MGWHIQNLLALRKRKSLYTSTLGMKNFQIDPSVAMEMHRLQSVAWWNVLVTRPYTIRNSHILDYSLNTKSSSLHKNNVFLDYNLKTSHILCYYETHFNLHTCFMQGMIVYNHYTTWHHMEHSSLWELNILLQYSMEIQGKVFMSLLSSNL